MRCSHRQLDRWRQRGRRKEKQPRRPRPGPQWSGGAAKGLDADHTRGVRLGALTKEHKISKGGPASRPEGDTVRTRAAGLSISPHCPDPRKPSGKALDTGLGRVGETHGGDGRVRAESSEAAQAGQSQASRGRHVAQAGPPGRESWEGRRPAPTSPQQSRAEQGGHRPGLT